MTAGRLSGTTLGLASKGRGGGKLQARMTGLLDAWAIRRTEAEQRCTLAANSSTDLTFPSGMVLLRYLLPSSTSIP